MSGPEREGADAAVRVVRGSPDDDELAALVAGIVAARTAVADDDVSSRPATSPWSDHGRRLGLRRPVRPDGWRWSLHP